MTLIEVLCGLALLAALLGGLLVVKVRTARQWLAANRQLAAVAAADALLERWWDAPRDIPRVGEGRVDGGDNLFWRTRIVERPEAGALGAQVVRLVIVADPTRLDAPELARVEILLPAPEPDDGPPVRRPAVAEAR